MIIRSSITAVIAALATASAMAQGLTKGLAVRAVSVDGRPVSWRSGGTLRTKPSPMGLLLDFGAAPGSNWAPLRMRYKLEGWDHDWQLGGGYMFLAIRFCNEAGDKVAQQAFNVIGESAGWNGNPMTSPLTHRRETVTVPPGGSRLVVVISSAGPPATVGIYVVDNLVVSRQASAGASSEILLRSPFNRELDGKGENELPGGAERDGSWQRDGITPSIAKVAELGPDARVKAFELLDEDPLGHGEWHNRLDLAPHVAAGEQLVIEWNELYSLGVADLRRASYEGLAPGDYRFRVEEVTAMGLPTGVGVSLPIRVPRALWETEWFWAAVAAALIGAVAVGGRYYAGYKLRRVVARLEYQRMMERERLRIAQDIHDDLGARVTQISLFSAMAQGNPALPEKARSDFERISRMSRELVSSLYETVWAVNPDNDNLEALGDYLCQMASRLCEAAQLRCRLKVTNLPADIQVSSQIRHNITMAAKESVHNVIKHARASEVSISVTFTARILTVSIQDDGCGFHGNSGGNGLINIRRRLEDIGGTCLVESQNQRGTAIHLRLAVPTLELAPRELLGNTRAPDAATPL